VADRYTATRSYGGVSAEARTAARRERLIDAAIGLFGTQGYVTTGVKQLCREAGVTDRYFYESFRDRAELFAAAFERIVGELLDAVGAAALTEPRTPEHQARAAVDAFIRAVTADRAKARVLFLEAGAVGGDFGRDVRATTRRFADLITTAARPHLPLDVPDHRLAMGSLSLIGAMGIVVLEWLDGELDATVEDLTDHFVSLLLAAGDAGTRN
jgi:AcrR family transcriptional regulator